jgi:hypothetical protein
MYMNNTDNPTLHLDTNKCKETKLWLHFYVNSHSRVFSNDQEKKDKQRNTYPPICIGARVAQSVRSLDLTTHTSLSPIRRGFAPGFVNDKKGCTRLAAASDKVYQLLAQVRGFLRVLRLSPPLKLVAMI